MSWVTYLWRRVASGELSKGRAECLAWELCRRGVVTDAAAQRCVSVLRRWRR